MSDLPAKVRQLVASGVVIRNPQSVDICDSIDPDRIAPGTVIHAGCRLSGKETSIGPSCVLGDEAPVTLAGCQLGTGVRLSGGFFSGAVFLDGVTFGSGAHVRPGTLIEEQASCAHTVGLKQTMLMPFVTLGSLINFCDCLMAGGTDRKNHSEVGSSYIHFNYTPNQDKATASLIGDVPRGVMLDRSPIFLGGQGGLVGPTRIAYGTIVAAGTICRKDVTDEGMLVFGNLAHSLREAPFESGAYGDISRILRNNLAYIGNLRALREWYSVVRSRFMTSHEHSRACHSGALLQINAMLDERVKRLDELAGKMEFSVGLAGKKGAGSGTVYGLQARFAAKWPRIREELGTVADCAMKDRDAILSEVSKAAGADYIGMIRNLSPAARESGTRWLQSIVDSTASVWKLLEE